MHARLGWALALVSLGSSPARAQTEQRYFDWTTFIFAVDEYADRRARLMHELRGDRAAFLAPSGTGISHGETFRVRDEFLYFTGLEIPGALLIVDPLADQSLVFLPRRDERFESASRPNDFPGRPLADDPVLQQRSGSLRIHPIEDLADWLRDREDTGYPVAVFSALPDGAVPLEDVLAGGPSPEGTLLTYLTEHHPRLPVRSAGAAVATLRMIKSPSEVAALRRSARATVAGIRVAARAIRDGVDERTLEGILEAEFKKQGAQRVAFASIVKSGPNSLWPWRILASHYDRRNRTMRDGDLVIFDVGAELDFHVSDVGRTFPVSGRFSPKQRAILQMQLSVADAVIAAIRPGLTFEDLGDVARRAIPGPYRPHMQAGLHFGHHVGLSAGDPSLSAAPLAPGMVFTVEPWFYDHEAGLAVFVEDVVLVTEAGADVLTADLPRRPEELEALMRAER